MSALETFLHFTARYVSTLIGLAGQERRAPGVIRRPQISRKLPMPAKPCRTPIFPQGSGGRTGGSRGTQPVNLLRPLVVMGKPPLERHRGPLAPYRYRWLLPPCTSFSLAQQYHRYYPTVRLSLQPNQNNNSFLEASGLLFLCCTKTRAAQGIVLAALLGWRLTASGPSTVLAPSKAAT